MGSHKTISCTTHEIPPPPPPPPVADYNVTGNPNPDCKGDYFVTGTYGGEPYYRREDGAYFLWWEWSAGEWWITVILGDMLNGYWYRDMTIIGNYGGKNGYTGTAVVKAGPG